MPLYHTTMVMITAGSDWATAVFALLLGAPLKHAHNLVQGTPTVQGTNPGTYNKISFMYSQTMSPASSTSSVASSQMSADFKEFLQKYKISSIN